MYGSGPVYKANQNTFMHIESYYIEISMVLIKTYWYSDCYKQIFKAACLDNNVLIVACDIYFFVLRKYLIQSNT